MASPFEQVNRDINPNNALVDDLTGFVRLYFGGESLTLVDPKSGPTRYVPQYLQSFEFHRVTNGLGRFSITMVDPEWTDVESRILRSSSAGNRVELEYGMLGVDGKVNTSSRLNAIIVKYDMEMFLGYSVITAQGLCLGISTLGSTLVGSSTHTSSFLKDTISSRGTTNISSYMIELAKVLGFSDKDGTIDVEETESNFSKEDLGTTEDRERILTCDNSTILNHITSVLIPRAVSKTEKKSPFVFYVSNKKLPSPDGKSRSGADVEKDSKGVGKEVFHFHSMARDIEKIPRTKLTLFSDKTSHIKSFKPSFEHTVSNIVRGTDVISFGYDRVSGELKRSAQHNDSGPSKMDSPSPPQLAKTGGYVPGEGTNQDASLNYVHSVAASAPLTAELVMVGDVSYDLLDCMDIFVNIPTGKRKGEPHNTTNRYIVVGIKDTIQDGVFDTTLKLCTGYGFTPAGQDAVKASTATSSVATGGINARKVDWDGIEKGLTVLQDTTSKTRTGLDPRALTPFFNPPAL